MLLAPGVLGWKAPVAPRGSGLCRPRGGHPDPVPCWSPGRCHVPRTSFGMLPSPRSRAWAERSCLRASVSPPGWGTSSHAWQQPPWRKRQPMRRVSAG